MCNVRLTDTTAHTEEDQQNKAYDSPFLMNGM